jgi:hypothetical protein
MAWLRYLQDLEEEEHEPHEGGLEEPSPGNRHRVLLAGRYFEALQHKG